MAKGFDFAVPHRCRRLVTLHVSLIHPSQMLHIVHSVAADLLDLPKFWFRKPSPLFTK